MNNIPIRRQNAQALISFSRVNPDTIGCVWTGEFDLNALHVDREIFESGKKKLRIQKYPDTYGWGLSLVHMIPVIHNQLVSNFCLYNTLSTAQTGNYTELHFCNVSKQRMFILM